jgi:drug/metabolite transporter (DMT)-like permease
MPKITALISQLPGRAYLLIATLIFGAANAVTRQLHELGAQHPVEGRNPISFCNSLFVGNLCALIALILIYHREWNVQTLRQITWKDWVSLSIVAILGGALAPALIFTALDLTTVNNVVLIGRIEPPIVLALSVWLLRAKVNVWVVAGAIAAFVGVVLTILLQQVGISLGGGEVMTAIAALALAVSAIISKVQLSRIPLGIFSTFRMFVGTIVFFVVVLKLYGPVHFIDVFSPFLWQWMLIYSAVIVVGGQLSWFMGLKQSTASEVSLANSFSPIAGVLGAYLILGEAPNTAQYVGGSLILIGIILGQIGISRMSTRAASTMMPTAIAMDMEVGFKGV